MMARALACVALQQQADDAESPTMAEDRVFDSRVDPLVFKQFEKAMPGIAVYTDDDDGIFQNRGTSDGPIRRYVDLRVEIAIGSFGTEIVDDNGTTVSVFDIPMTDAQLEAQLDLFEQQVRWALTGYPDRAYTNAFMNYVVRLEEIKSVATRDESGNNRFASRRLHYKIEIPDDCPPYALALAPGQLPPTLIPFCEKLGAFPAPWIRPMLKAMCSDPAMRAVLNALAGSPNPYAIVPLLKRIGMNVDAIEPEADPNLLAAQGKTQGPDGRIEVEGILEIP
jgi:hypothetical protein